MVAGAAAGAAVATVALALVVLGAFFSSGLRVGGLVARGKGNEAEGGGDEVLHFTSPFGAAGAAGAAVAGAAAAEATCFSIHLS